MQKMIIFKNTKVSYYFIAGKNSNSTLLFLHGFGCDSSIWKDLQSGIISEANQISIDFPPFGESGNLFCEWVLEDYVEIVEKILIIENCHNIDIICHSFGARVAIELAINNSLINNLIIIAGAGIRENKLKTKTKILAYKTKKVLSKFHLYSKDKLKNNGSEEYRSLSPIMKKTFSNIVNNDQRKRLKLIKNQTLILWAKDDNATTIKSAKLMNKKIKNSALYVFENGGHFAFLVHKQNFINAINIFLNKGDNKCQK